MLRSFDEGQHTGNIGQGILHEFHSPGQATNLLEASFVHLERGSMRLDPAK